MRQSLENEEYDDWFHFAEPFMTDEGIGEVNTETYLEKPEWKGKPYCEYLHNEARMDEFVFCVICESDDFEEVLGVYPSVGGSIEIPKKYKPE